MITPLILLIISIIGCVAAIAFPAFSDALLVFGPMLLASLWLVISAGRSFFKAAGTLDDVATGPEASKPETPKQGPLVIIDGSNVMYWRKEEPEWTPLIRVVRDVSRAGFTPGVMFDANAGYKLEGKYMHDRDFAKRLGLPMDRIMVVPKGTPADGYILQAARDYSARIVTNDKFRDWADRFPEVLGGDLMIKGHYEGRELRLSF